MEVEAFSNLNINGRPLPVKNFSNVPDAVLYGHESMREVAQVMSRWVDNARAAASRTSMFDRGAYIPPENAYDEMRSARHAVRYDSVVSGIAELTESFAFQGVKWESDNSDEADVFNQMARDQNLDDVIRKMWREEFTYGQFVCAKMWGYKTYTVRGKTTTGSKRKKKYKVWAPLRMRILDSLKVVPVGTGPLGGDGLAWQATGYEIGNWQQCWNGDTIDPLMLTFFQEQYKPSFLEAGELSALGVDVSRLLSLNPDWVFRHTQTKPDYERFADVRMKSLFTLLDMKQQLLMADRAALIGAANYILLIRKGDDKLPAQRAELEALQENYNFIAKMPVIISDHRLSVDIISPKIDMTLDKDKYDVIDSRIKERLLGLLAGGGGGSSHGSNSSGGGGIAAQALPIARMMENRRHMLARTLESEIARAVCEHPKNRDLFEKEPSMVYTPRNIGLTLDNSYAQSLISLRTQREVSRETILEFFGLDEATEAMRMQYEAEFYDDIFKTEIPYTAGSPAEGVDPAMDKKDSSLSLTVGPDGTLKATPPSDGKTATAKPGAKATDPKSMPASGQPKGKAVATPNGTGESPKVSGARGGRPVGGGKTAANPVKTAKPSGTGGSQTTKASEDENA